MLKRLTIKDYALISNVEVEFEEGLNIITGETGAGKSIIIGALNLLLGERANISSIRKGARKAIVEAVFDVAGNTRALDLLKENEFDLYDELILRREITEKGANRNFVNDTPANLNFLKELGFLLVDIHGQHEHQSLLRTSAHIEMLDEFGDYAELLEKFKLKYSEFKTAYSQLNELKRKEELLREKKELYEFQINEIDAVNPAPEEDKEIEARLRLLENSEEMLETTQQIFGELYESDGSITERLGALINKFGRLTQIDDSLAPTAEQLEFALESLSDVARLLASYRDRIEHDPEKLEELRERIGELNLLKKKYGNSLKAVLEYREKIGEEFNTAANFEEKINELSGKIEKLRLELGDIALQLSERRKLNAKKLKTEVEKILLTLGINNANFQVKFEFKKVNDDDPYFVLFNNEKIKVFKHGADAVEFLISTNLGEDPKPLARVASGGEISRIMLALKTCLARSEKLPIMVFDEIDSGVSGRIASKVGKALKELSEFHQIIAITHLPQIAALSNAHFNVAKIEKENRVTTSIKKLNPEEKLNEIARLLSGNEITSTALQTAKELIEQ